MIYKDIEMFLSELIHWNKKLNLISSRDEQFLQEHVEDSLSLVPHIKNSKFQKIIDIGSGNGFPVIPLAFWAKAENIPFSFVATEVISKKITFLNWCKAKFTLPINVEKVDKAFSCLGSNLIISRAFSSVDNIIKWRDTHAPDSAEFLLLKGSAVEKECRSAGLNTDEYSLYPNKRGYILHIQPKI